MEWDVVIGLEVHTQLKTKSKIFSGASTAYGATPNSQASMIDLAFPGTLPVLNYAVVEMALKFGIATHAEINRISAFDRKQYFYPDLPKGYQISQFYTPIVGQGYLDIQLDDGSVKRIGITRAHLEEDAGKSLHDVIPNTSGIDLNRAGTPLLEIVSEPDLRSAEEAVAYLKTLHSLVTYLEICDGNMQEGSFRCDANVSIRPKGSNILGTRSEIKNVNSFRYVEKAIHYEIERHIEILESGGTIAQETRLYDSVTNTTRSMRSKEEANDYRYFPDPDLLPVYISDAMMESARKAMPELPWEKQTRFQQDYHLSAYDAKILIADRLLADYFEQVVTLANAPAKLAANWVNGELAAALNKNNLSIESSPIPAEQLAGLIQRIHDNTISGKMAKTVFEAMWQGEGNADQIIEAKGLKQVSDSGALEAIIDQILAANPEQLAAYRSGKDKLFGFFVGQAMKATHGQANPQQLNDLLLKKLAMPASL
jgi:aspartyl-tRNA(Asn)/glutamyl-tRNA(Gln) amidotransferase subunit B